MADLSFRPDPEPPPAAPPNPAKPPAPAWVAGLKSGLLTVCKFLCILVVTIIMIVGLTSIGGAVHRANMRLDKIQQKLDELEKKIDDKKTDDPKVMPPAN